MKSNNGILDSKELEKRTKFWNKKTFRTFSKRELESSSRNTQKLLAAIKDLTLEEIKAEHAKPILHGVSVSTLQVAYWKNIEYAISIAPKSFKVKQG